MKFLIDAQLPFSLALWIRNQGFDVLHTFELPLKNATPDREVLAISESQNRVVISKDSDFLDSFLLHRKPNQLILIKTGNIKNQELLDLFDKYFKTILSMLKEYNMVEVYADQIIAHA